MKKLLCLLLCLALLAGCGAPAAPEPRLPAFSGLSDPLLLNYVEDTVYQELVTTLDSDDFFVENIQAVYISEEYLTELSANSRENIYFGFTLSELDAVFEGEKYVFTLGDDGQTTVQAFQEARDPYGEAVRNLAVGGGVILLCVTVSVVSGAAGATAVSVIFAASAKTGAAMALSSGVFSGVAAGAVTYLDTGSMDAALEQAAVSGSEGFKWGAVSGVITGGASQAAGLFGATRKGLTMNQAAQIQRQSKYPLDVIKEFSSMEQYEICKNAGLPPRMVDGNTALFRSIDLDFVDDLGRTNLQRMEKGLAALAPDGSSYQLHHIGQQADSTLAILTQAEHLQGGNHAIWHLFGNATQVHGAGSTWDLQRQSFWKNMAAILGPS